MKAAARDAWSIDRQNKAQCQLALERLAVSMPCKHPWLESLSNGTVNSSSESYLSHVFLGAACTASCGAEASGGGMFPTRERLKDVRDALYEYTPSPRVSVLVYTRSLSTLPKGRSPQDDVAWVH